MIELKERLAVMRALTVLVNDKIISAGRAREIAWMSADEQRRFWREENSYVQGMKIETHLQKARFPLERRIAELEADVERLRSVDHRKVMWRLVSALEQIEQHLYNISHIMLEQKNAR